MVAEPGCWCGLRDFPCLARARDRTQISSREVERNTSRRDTGLRACWFPSFLRVAVQGLRRFNSVTYLDRKFGKVGL